MNIKKIKRIMREKSITKTELSKFLNKSYNTVHNYLRGKYNIPGEVAEKIEKFVTNYETDKKPLLLANKIIKEVENDPSFIKKLSQKSGISISSIYAFINYPLNPRRQIIKNLEQALNNQIKLIKDDKLKKTLKSLVDSKKFSIEKIGILTNTSYSTIYRFLYSDHKLSKSVKIRISEFVKKYV